MKITVTITIDEDDSDYEPKHVAPEYAGPRFPNGQPAQNERGELLDNLGQVIPLVPSGVEGTKIGRAACQECGRTNIHDKDCARIRGFANYGKGEN